MLRLARKMKLRPGNNLVTKFEIAKVSQKLKDKILDKTQVWYNGGMAQALRWKTEQRRIKDLIPADYNPRKLTDAQAEELERSLRKFDLAEIPAINTDNVILAGHQRLSLLAKMGRGDEEIDVRVPNRKLSDKEAREYNLRSNKNTGEWDQDKLFAMSPELLKEVGFGEKDIQKLIDSHTEVKEDDYDPTEALKRPSNVARGDIWQLGSHRLMCGDSTAKEDVEMLMDGKKADMVFTDPPYGVSYALKNEYLNTIAPGNRIQTPIENDHMDLGDTSDFIFRLFCQIKEILALKSCYYITAPQGGDLMMMMMMMQKAGIPLRHCLIWVKNNHVLGRTDYNYKHEPILYGWVDRHEFYGNGEHRFSTWEIDKPLKNDLHPTMKPIALIVNAIKNSTKDEQIVVDLCLGSGSTLIACEQTNRICYGMEIDPHYCQVIIDRWEKFTGEKANKIN